MTIPTTSPSPFLAMGDKAFVSLTTFRKRGKGVPTPVWIARDGDTLLVTTPEESGKVKRLRNNAKVELRPCTRSGTVIGDGPPVVGRVEFEDDPMQARYFTDLIRAKYGPEYLLTMFIERLVAKRQKPRVILKITAA